MYKDMILEKEKEKAKRKRKQKLFMKYNFSMQPQKPKRELFWCTSGRRKILYKIKQNN